MCAQIQAVSSNAIHYVGSALYHGAEQSILAIREGIIWLGRKIDDLTHAVLPHWAAVTVAAMTKSMPFIAMRLFLPTPLFFAGLGIIVVYKIITTPKGEPVTAETAENGFAFAGLWQGGQQITQGFATNSLQPVLFGVVNIVASCIFLLRTGLVKDMCGIEKSTGKEDATAQQETQQV